jgi:hypothetical protein
MKYELNQVESIMFLSYLCYGIDGFTEREISNFIDTNREFLEKPNDVDAEYYFALFQKLIDSTQPLDLITLALNEINPSLYKKVLVYLMEGVMSDGEINEAETVLMQDIVQKMKIDISFYQKTLEVLIEKYL